MLTNHWNRTLIFPVYSNRIVFVLSYYTCDKQVLWESAGAFFPARQLSRLRPQVA